MMCGILLTREPHLPYPPKSILITIRPCWRDCDIGMGKTIKWVLFSIPMVPAGAVNSLKNFECYISDLYGVFQY